MAGVLLNLLIASDRVSGPHSIRQLFLTQNETSHKKPIRWPQLFLMNEGRLERYNIAAIGK